jgi:hypothetical protein
MYLMVRGFFHPPNVTIVGIHYLYLLNCYMFRSYDHLHVEIYLVEITLLANGSIFFRISRG